MKYIFLIIIFLGLNSCSSKKALNPYDKALLSIDNQIKDYNIFGNSLYVRKRARLYNQKGIILVKKNKYGKALSSFNISLNFYNHSKNPNLLNVAEVFFNIAYLLDLQGKYQESLKNYDTAISIYERVTNKKYFKLAQAYINKSTTYLKLEQYDKSIKYSEKALSIVNPKNPDILKIYMNLANAWSNKGDYLKALDIASTAQLLLVEKNIGNDLDLINIFNTKGGIFVAKGNYTNALTNFKLALKISLDYYGENHIMTASIYSNSASVYSSQGDKDKALELYNKVLHIYQNLKQDTTLDIANIYNNIATTLSGKGEYAEALQYYNKSLEKYRTKITKDTPFIANVYNNMASVYGDMNQHKTELLYYDKSIHIYQKIFGNKNIDTIHTKMNLLTSEIEYFQYHKKFNKLFYSKQIKKIQQLLNDSIQTMGVTHPLTATLYKNLGSLFFKINQFQKSLESYNKALNVYDMANIETWDTKPITSSTRLDGKFSKLNFKNLKNHSSNVISLYLEIGRVYTKLNNYKKAFASYEEALKFMNAMKSENLDIKRTFYYDKAWTYYLKRDYKEAYNNIQEFFNLSKKLQSTNFKFLYNSQKLSINNEVNFKFLFEVSTKYLTQLKESNLDEYNRVSKVVLNNWLQTKGTILENDNILSAIESKTTNLQVKKLIKTYKQLNIELANLENIYPPQKKHIQKIQSKINQIELKISQKNQSFRELLELDNIKYTNIANNLNHNQLYIDFVKTDENYYLFTLNKEKEITFNKIDNRKIEHNVKDVRNINKKSAQAIGNQTITLKLKKESQNVLTELYTILIEPLGQELKNKTSLIISPDGLLNFLPFEALYHNGKYLIEDYDISYISSGREFVRQTKRQKANPKYEMICFGNPDFNSSLPIAETKSRASEQRKQHALDTWEQYKNFSPIGDDEIKTIRKYYSNALIYAKKNATASNLMRVESSKILHFSTHGKFLNNDTIKNPMLKAGLALAGANNKNSDGIVTALKLSALDLKDTELVVLSACESGLGDIQNSEGVMGLPKAFLQAGAREVIMSLWSVSTLGTAELMEHFYENVHKGQSYSMALRNAKIKMIEEKQHPYYWSAFILHGVSK